jgi:hypothetical protein
MAAESAKVCPRLTSLNGVERVNAMWGQEDGEDYWVLAYQHDDFQRVAKQVVLARSFLTIH